ncbi:MAG: DUF166 family protein [Methanomassiliicoccales archaeon]
MVIKRLQLATKLDGENIVRGLGILAKEHGLELDYLPVTVAYANIESSHKKIYQNIRIVLAQGIVAIRGPRNSGEIISDEVYDTIDIDIPESLIETFSALVEDLGEKIAWYRHREPQLPAEPLCKEEESYTAPPPKNYADGFRILIVLQGEYGERIAKNLQKKAPPYWNIQIVRLKKDLPLIIDDAKEYLPESLPEVDLVLFLSETVSAPQLIPEVVRRSKTRGIIAPIDNSEWMSFGQVSQISRILSEWGVEFAFPRPFCSLESSNKPTIDEFSRWFGKPIIEIETHDNKTVNSIRIIRGVPCGNTEYVAENVKGVRLDELIEKAALTHHHYPCLASMKVEPDLGDTLMHASGFITKDVFDKEVRKFLKKKITYLDPSQFH